MKTASILILSSALVLGSCRCPCWEGDDDDSAGDDDSGDDDAGDDDTGDDDTGDDDTGGGEIPAGNLIAYWPLDSDTDDHSGNAHHGTPLDLTAATGVVGGCFEFDGDSSKITVPDAPELDLTTPHTIMLWFLADSVPPVYAYDLITKNTHGISSGWMVGYRDSTLLRWDWYPLNNLYSSSASSAGTWHHLAFTYDGTVREIYVDGTLDTSAPSGPTSTNGAAVVIGQHAGGTPEYWFDGLIDEVAIYGEALDGADIAAYVAGIQGIDGDGDGYSAAAGDCDDTDPAVSPGAAEICEGTTDHDCDGLDDRDDDDCLVFYDGFDGPTLDPSWVDSGYGRPGTWSVAGGALVESTLSPPSPAYGAMLVFAGLDPNAFPTYLSVETSMRYSGTNPAGEHGLAPVVTRQGMFTATSYTAPLHINGSGLNCQASTQYVPFAHGPGTWYEVRMEFDRVAEVLSVFVDDAYMQECDLSTTDMTLEDSMGFLVGANQQISEFDYLRIVGF